MFCGVEVRGQRLHSIDVISVLCLKDGFLLFSHELLARHAHDPTLHPQGCDQEQRLQAERGM
jgi:hypothetical protein